ncbi:PhnD/SsuA/transferrin family substrate-binding protein [Alkalihalobacterium chitinilyticum]|uniref:PhnD/SsuA/transferrin family substrate-binding protein n=1 Tax=Alkalihalobacterium chitinilyticum TaxID=2980103 RepID=A0ABT5VHE7_9BACI|nr:PhnD/SsuA/transferrin family substrate-binding protein [Alkalihalobacterium chitinilyticum]MDE5414752.1 PhnD/SsuA/transferrin family substrate-binding protein [Alkalihalobacterium chitinilyticum]
MKKAFLLLFTITLIAIMAACNSSSNTESSSGSTTEEPKTETKAAVEDKDTLTIVWYPNESGADLKDARDEIAAEIEKATGKEVKHQTTTDYLIAIETLVNGNADLAFMGAQGYIEANIKNNNIQPLVVPSGASGTLDDAVYYSWLSVKKGNEEEYMSGSDFTIDNIVGKRFSFVSNSSTSGFRVPSAGIVSHFSQMEEHKDLTPDDLLEGGTNNFFSEVLYGGSHQGTLVNLLADRADIVSICDSCVNNYIELVSGEENRAGSVYRVLDDATEPFNTMPGEEFVLISVTPVLNAPFVVNQDNVSAELIEQLVSAFTSDDMANNEKVFVPKDSELKGLFSKSADERFVKVEDAWFDPIRELSK